MPKVVFLVPKGLLSFLQDRLGCGLGWVLGPNFHSGMGWVELVIWWVGLGWVEQYGPTDNFVLMLLPSAYCRVPGQQM